MDINSIQGANAYAANRPPAESTLVQNQNRQAEETELNKEKTTASQQAFEVNITQEARAAAEAENSRQTTQAAPVEPPQPPEQTQNTGNRQQPMPIVDIVA